MKIEVYKNGEFVGAFETYETEYMNITTEADERFGNDGWDDYKVKKR